MFMFLGHAVGSYSKGDPQLRRHCGRDIDDLDDSDKPSKYIISGHLLLLAETLPGERLLKRLRVQERLPEVSYEDSFLVKKSG